MLEPKVSICIPAYQQPQKLQRALESISEQTYEDFEVIITDDSNDSSVENVVLKYLDDSRFKYFKNTIPLGSPENWNKAISLASGEYIKILHHDDRFSGNNSLEHFVRLLDENPDTDFGFSSCYESKLGIEAGIIHIPDKKNIDRLHRDPEALFPENVIGAPSVTIFRRSAKEIFNPKLKWVVDLDFYIRMLKKNKHFAFDKKALVTITTDDSDQVTSHCISDRKIQIYEWIYLYSSILTRKKILPKTFVFIWRLFKGNLITSASDLKKLCGDINVNWLLIILATASGMRTAIRSRILRSQM